MSSKEAQLRATLGIPEDAQRILLFSESSHWDTNWLQTSEEYFKRRIEPIFAAVIAALEHEPTRIYCIESLFFLKLYWERHPEQQGRLRELFARRQLRMLASSYTTPDTLLPHTEAILRDYQLGYEWLLQNGLPAAPGMAYFPDNFGHSPHLPSLMQAVGVQAVAVTRIDGMYFIVSDYRRRSHFPLAGSTAHLLEKVHRSHAFVWRDDSGAELVCHWNAHTYFQGDMLAHTGIIRWDGKVFALPWRTRAHIARRIDGYVQQLAPFARTPYLFCPIGMDFNDPIAHLPALLQRYNEEHYTRTGTWTLLAGLDDYLALLACQRAALPILEADPNPYWMGFLATRPEIKQRSVRIARTLLLAEKLATTKPPDEQLEHVLQDAWSTLALTNHHDCITGTSPDRVWLEEQRPWLASAEASARRALELATTALATEQTACPHLAVEKTGELVHVQTAHYRLTLSEARGGCLTSFVVAGRECLSGLGFDLVAMHDEGGLWRLGHEFAGGRFAERERASARAAAIEIDQTTDGLCLRVTSTLAGHKFVRELICRGDQPAVRLRVHGVAARRVTVTVSFQTAFDPERLEMDTVGGVITRPRERLYDPTYWAVPSRLCLFRSHDVLHALFEAPTAAALAANGELTWIVARNATKERAFGLLPVLAHPIGGTNDDEQVHESALLCSAPASSAALRATRKDLECRWKSSPLERQALALAESLVRCDLPEVCVLALKHNARRDGLFLRLFSERLPSQPARITLQHGAVQTAFVSDALERELSPLKVESSSSFVVPLVQRMTSLLLRLR